MTSHFILSTLRSSMLFLSLVIIVACNSENKTIALDTEKNENLQKAVVIDYSQKEDSCSFLIRIEESKLLLQPYDLNDSFKEDGLEIFIDYSPSRRVQGPCALGMPITINEIKKHN